MVCRRKTRHEIIQKATEDKRKLYFCIKKSKQSELCFDVVPLTGIEPVRIIRPTDFKSVVSAYSTTATKTKIFRTEIIVSQTKTIVKIFSCSLAPFF